MIREFALAFLLMASSAYALTNSTLYCLDNTTLLENITVYKDGNASSIWTTTDCRYNCSNSTQSCNPPSYQQNLIIFAIICVIAFFGWRFARWIR